MLCRREGSLRLVRRCCAESGALKLVFYSGKEVENYENFKVNAPVDLQNVQNYQKVSRRLPKGGQKGANGSQREPKGSQREPTGSQGATKMHQKIDLRKRSRKGNKSDAFGACRASPRPSILEAISSILELFLDRFRHAFGIDLASKTRHSCC